MLRWLFARSPQAPAGAGLPDALLDVGAVGRVIPQASTTPAGSGPVAEQALSPLQLHALMHQAPMAVMAHDPKTLHVLYANRAALRLYDAETIEQLNAAYLAPSASPSCWPPSPYGLTELRHWFQRAQDFGPQRFEWLTRTLLGRDVWETVFLQPIGLGRERCVLSASFDITAQKLSAARAAGRHALLLALAQDRPFPEIVAAAITLAEACAPRARAYLAQAEPRQHRLHWLCPATRSTGLPGTLSAVAADSVLQGRHLGLTGADALLASRGSGETTPSGWLLAITSSQGTVLGALLLVFDPAEPMPDELPEEVSETLSLLALILERRRDRELLQRRIDLERVVRSISIRLLGSTDGSLTDSIQHALQQLGEFIGADRCYLMRHSADGDTIDNTDEWCAPGVPPQIRELQNIPTVQLQSWLDLLQDQGLLIIRQRDDMPPNPHWARIFHEGGIQSVLFVPMVHNQQLIGLLGFDAVTAPRDWEEGTVTLVQLVADLLVHGILRQQLVAALRYDADHDPLTGLANRRHVEQILAYEAERVARHGGSFALVMFDIDHFKRVNDNHCHDMGDEVLRMLAGLVVHHRRRSDVVARWGGEEFLMLLPQTDLAAASQIAESVRRLVASASFPIPDEPLTISLGVAVFESGADWHQVIAAADAALYRAKQEGRNCVRVAAG